MKLFIKSHQNEDKVFYNLSNPMRIKTKFSIINSYLEVVTLRFPIFSLHGVFLLHSLCPFDPINITTCSKHLSRQYHKHWWYCFLHRATVSAAVIYHSNPAPIRWAVNIPNSYNHCKSVGKLNIQHHSHVKMNLHMKLKRGRDQFMKIKLS